MAKRPRDMETLKEGLKTIEDLVDNNFDKSNLIEEKIPECILDTLRRMNEIPSSAYKENEALLELFKQTFNTLKKIEKDPSLARIISKNGGAYVMTKSLHKLNSISGKTGEKPTLANITKSQPNKTDEIIGSEDPIERSIESAFMSLEELTVNPKYAEKLNILESDNPVLDDVHEIILKNHENPVIALKGLKILENSLKVCNPEIVAKNAVKLKEISNTSEELAKHYPNLPVIAEVSKNIAAISKGQKKDSQNINKEKAEIIAATLVSLGEVQKEITQEKEKFLEGKTAVIEGGNKKEELNKDQNQENINKDEKKEEEKKEEEKKIEENQKNLIEEENKPELVPAIDVSELLTKLELVADSLEDFNTALVSNKATPAQKAQTKQVI